MSALPPKADIRQRDFHVRFVPKADITSPHSMTSSAHGQLVVRGVPGRTMMKEYHDNPQATAETLRGEWLYSGDNVRMDEDGYFFFVDRGKDLIKRAGENV